MLLLLSPWKAAVAERTAVATVFLLRLVGAKEEGLLVPVGMTVAAGGEPGDRPLPRASAYAVKGGL